MTVLGQPTGSSHGYSKQCRERRRKSEVPPQSPHTTHCLCSVPSTHYCVTMTHVMAFCSPGPDCTTSSLSPFLCLFCKCWHPSEFCPEPCLLEHSPLDSSTPHNFNYNLLMDRWTAASTCSSRPVCPLPTEHPQPSQTEMSSEFNTILVYGVTIHSSNPDRHLRGLLGTDLI